MTSIERGPHYKLSSRELAVWLDRQGRETWWNVDGDPYLTGRVSFPCPAHELAAKLGKIDRLLLVQARQGDHDAKGQILTNDQIDDKVIDQFRVSLFRPHGGFLPTWMNDRLLSLCWEGDRHEWMLLEDSMTAKEVAAETASIEK